MVHHRQTDPQSLPLSAVPENPPPLTLTEYTVPPPQLQSSQHLQANILPMLETCVNSITPYLAAAIAQNLAENAPNVASIDQRDIPLSDLPAQMELLVNINTVKHKSPLEKHL